MSNFVHCFCLFIINGGRRPIQREIVPNSFFPLSFRQLPLGPNLIFSMIRLEIRYRIFTFCWIGIEFLIFFNIIPSKLFFHQFQRNHWWKHTSWGKINMLIKNIIYLTSINLLNCAIIAYSPSECKTQNGTACVFPFFYKGVKYSGCTTVDNRETPWCSTLTDGDVNYIDHYWGNCAQDCTTTTTTSTTTTTTTKTTTTTTTTNATITTITTTATPTTTITTTTTSSSIQNPLGCKTQNGTTCVFPFIYKGVKYSGCTTVDNRGTPWCSTKIDKMESVMNMESVLRIVLHQVHQDVKHKMEYPVFSH